MAEAKRSGSKVRVDALTTETRVVDANPDGTFTQTVSAVQVRMRHGSGWADLDLTLADDGTAVRPKTAPMDVSFGRGGDSRMSTVGDGKGHSIIQRWPYGNLPAPVLAGSQATYPDVLPGVDLVLVSARDRVGQVFKVKTAAALADPRLKELRVSLQPSGATVASDGDGGVAVKGKDTGQVVLAASKGAWWDSKYPDASASDPGGPGVSRPYDLSLATDAAGVGSTGIAAALGEAKGLAFPVYIDPIYTNQRHDFVYIDSAFPATAYWDGQYTDASVHVGFLPAAWDTTYWVNHTTRGFFQFDTSASGGAVILAAKLNVTDVWSSSCTPTTVRAIMTGDVEPWTNWNSPPVQYQQLDAKSFASGYSASCPAATQGFDMMAAKSAIGSNTQLTVGLYADNDTWDQNSWKRFDNGATVTIQYGHPPNPPQITGMTNCGAHCPGASVQDGITRTPWPVFTFYGSDPDTTDGNITAWMSVTKDGESSARWWMAGGQAVWLAPTGQSGSWGYGSPGGTGTNPPLPDGHYTYSVVLVDQQGLVSQTTKYTFWVDTTPPPPPVVTPPGVLSSGKDPAGVVGSTQYAFTISAAPRKYDSVVDPIKGFIYSVTSAASNPGTPDATMGCGDRKGAFTMICPANGATSLPVTIAAVDSSTTVHAWSVDVAGNISDGCTLMGSSCPPKDTAASPKAWYTFTVGKAATVPSRTLPLTDNASGVSRAGIVLSGFDGPGGSCATTTPASPTAPEGFSYSAGGYSATTGGGAVDSSQSYTLAIWACPTGTGASTVFAQTDSAGNTPLQLGIAGDGHWALTTRDGSGNATIVESVQTVAAGQWALITAQYDRSNTQLRLAVAYTDTKDTWAVVNVGTPAAPGTGTQAYLAKRNAADAQTYTGLLVRPVLTQSVLTAAQVQNLWSGTATSQIQY